MLAPECRSWSIARMRTNVISSASEPWGVARPLKRGNKHIPAVLQLLGTLLKYRVPWALENPQSSLLWKTPDFPKLLLRPDVSSCVFDQCAFGTPWRKRTRVMFGMCDYDDIEALGTYKCNSHKQCHYSRKPHVKLVGTMPGSSVPRTAIAQTYPTRLSRTLATILVAAAADQPH